MERHYLTMWEEVEMVAMRYDERGSVFVDYGDGTEPKPAYLWLKPDDWKVYISFQWYQHDYDAYEVLEYEYWRDHMKMFVADEADHPSVSLD